jgi:hypothetical protein
MGFSTAATIPRLPATISGAGVSVDKHSERDDRDDRDDHFQSDSSGGVFVCILHDRYKAPSGICSTCRALRLTPETALHDFIKRKFPQGRPGKAQVLALVRDLNLRGVLPLPGTSFWAPNQIWSAVTAVFGPPERRHLAEEG